MKQRLVEYLCVAAFFAAMYVFVYFFIASFTSTGNGPIKWGKGWEQTKKELFGVE